MHSKSLLLYNPRRKMKNKQTYTKLAAKTALSQGNVNIIPKEILAKD